MNRLILHGTLTFCFFVASMFAFSASPLLGRFCPALAHAESPAPYATIEPKTGTAEDIFVLEIHIPLTQSETAIGTPSFLHSDHFEFTGLGVAQQLENINGVQRGEKVFSFRVSASGALAPGTYPLPKAQVPIDNQPTDIHLPSLTLVAGNQNGAANTTQSRPQGFDFTQLVDNLEPYVGQQVVYSAELMTTNAIARANLDELSLPDFARESFGKLEQLHRNVGDSVHSSVREAIFPIHSGTALIPPRTLSAEIRVPRRSTPHRRDPWNVFDDFMNDMDPLMPQQVVTKKFHAAPIELHVKELPPPPQHLEGVVPVGELSLQSTVDQKTVDQGGSITETIVLVSDGTLKAYELPKLNQESAKDFNVYVDKPKLDITPTQNRILFKKSFSVTFVPQKAGTLVLPSYSVTFFNPKQGRYLTLQSTTETIQVNPKKGANEPAVLRGAVASIDVHPESEKNEIRPQGEDLQPQYSGANLASRRGQISPRMENFLLLLAPLVTVLFGWQCQYRRSLLTNAQRYRSSQAHSRARSALKDPSRQTPEAVLTILREYLGARFALPADSLTSADVEGSIRPRMKDIAVNKQLEQLLQALQSAVYGGKNIEEKAARQLAEEARACLDAVEAAAVKR